MKRMCVAMFSLFFLMNKEAQGMINCYQNQEELLKIQKRTLEKSHQKIDAFNALLKQLFQEDNLGSRKRKIEILFSGYKKMSDYEKGLTIHRKNGIGATLLFQAVCEARWDIAHFLMDCGIDVNIQDDEKGNTALHILYMQGLEYVSAYRHLVERFERKALSYTRNSEGKTAEDIKDELQRGSNYHEKWISNPYNLSLEYLAHLQAGFFERD